MSEATVGQNTLSHASSDARIWISSDKSQKPMMIILVSRKECRLCLECVQSARRKAVYLKGFCPDLPVVQNPVPVYYCVDKEGVLHWTVLAAGTKTRFELFLAVFLRCQWKHTQETCLCNIFLS